MNYPMSIENKPDLFKLMAKAALSDGHATNASIETVTNNLEQMIIIEPSLEEIPQKEIFKMITEQYTLLHLCLICSGATKQLKNKPYPMRCVCTELEDNPY
jgi:hypothetical protein